MESMSITKFFGKKNHIFIGKITTKNIPSAAKRECQPNGPVKLNNIFQFAMSRAKIESCVISARHVNDVQETHILSEYGRLTNAVGLA